MAGQEWEASKLTKEPSPYGFRTMGPVLVFFACLVIAGVAVLPAFLRDHPFCSEPFVSKGADVRQAFFVFGDSYADVGNIPFGPARSPPYGMTWPGHPAGRFSDGHVQSDYLATQAFGIPSPSPYTESNMTSVADGINFAIGGSSMTYGYGVPSVGNQVRWFESLVKMGIYTEEALASSVTFLCVSGNDYGSYRGSFENYEPFVKEVVGLIEQNLRLLHGLGLRNIMVTTVAPLNCLPLRTFRTNYTACSPNATIDAVISTHNSLLETTLVNLLKDLTDINLILLRQDAAFQHLQTNPTFYNISQAFKPCCLGTCGVVDRLGKPLYTVCTDPDTWLLWDDVHPTQAAWKNVVNLYLNEQSFTEFAPSLQVWNQALSSNKVA